MGAGAGASMCFCRGVQSSPLPVACKSVNPLPELDRPLGEKVASALLGARQVHIALGSAIEDWHSKAKEGRYRALVIGSFYDATPMQVFRGRGRSGFRSHWGRGVRTAIRLAELPFSFRVVSLFDFRWVDRVRTSVTCFWGFGFYRAPLPFARSRDR